MALLITAIEMDGNVKAVNDVMQLMFSCLFPSILYINKINQQSYDLLLFMTFLDMSRGVCMLKGYLLLLKIITICRYSASADLK